MLDLDAIFNPDETMPARPTVPVPAPAPTSGIGPDDLPGDWRVDWEERAAVLEYEGGHPREQAEALALAEIIQQMGRVGAPAVG
jgi:hypothetical protein